MNRRFHSVPCKKPAMFVLSDHDLPLRIGKPREGNPFHGRREERPYLFRPLDEDEAFLVGTPFGEAKLRDVFGIVLGSGVDVRLRRREPPSRAAMAADRPPLLGLPIGVMTSRRERGDARAGTSRWRDGRAPEARDCASHWRHRPARPRRACGNRCCRSSPCWIFPKKSRRCCRVTPAPCTA